MQTNRGTPKTLDQAILDALEDAGPDAPTNVLVREIKKQVKNYAAQRSLHENETVAQNYYDHFVLLFGKPGGL